MKEKLKSRKLWVAIGGLVMVMATEWANINPETVFEVNGHEIREWEIHA